MQSNEFHAEQSFEDSSSFSHEVGVELTAGSEVMYGTPVVGEAGIKISVTGSYKHTWGETITDKKTFTATFPLDCPPKTRCTASATVKQVTLNIPYTMTIKTSQGKLFNSKGIYKKAYHWDMLYDVKEDKVSFVGLSEEQLVGQNEEKKLNLSPWMKVYMLPYVNVVGGFKYLFI